MTRFVIVVEIAGKRRLVNIYQSRKNQEHFVLSAETALIKVKRLSSRDTNSRAGKVVRQ
jgi:hypothetical protein